MKYLARITLLVVSALGLASTAGAQLYNFPPEIDRIGRTFASEPGRVAIVGEHLSLVTRVTVDGVGTPILRQSGTRITIQPDVSEPGFHLVIVRNPFGTAAGMLEVLPTISGGRTGNLMDVRIVNGSEGMCTLFYSTEFLDDPATLPDVGFHRLLDLDSMLSGGIFAVTIFTDLPITVSKFKIPKDVAITGLPFYFQGLCEQGFPDEGRTRSSFTNVSIIPGLPGNGHSN
jgi:hypothetical protein